MLVTTSGTWTGGISGGCLEGDALKRAQKAIMRNEVSSVVYDTSRDDEYQIGVGLGCNGLIETMFLPVDAQDPGNPVEKLRKISGARSSTVLLTCIGTEGDLVKAGQSVFLSGSAPWSSIIPSLQEVIEPLLEKNRTGVVETRDTAGKKVRILVEIILPRIRLIVIGENYDIYPMIQLGVHLDWEVHLVAKHRKLRSQPVLKSVNLHEKSNPENIPSDAFTAVVIMNHDYSEDKMFIRMYWKEDLAYLALLGPRVRMEKMMDELAHEEPGFSYTENQRFFSPAGLDLGSEGPEEIALSIVAEIVAHLKGRTGGFLRKRTGTIHERI